MIRSLPLLALSVAARADPVPEIRATRIARDEAPLLDGRLDDPAWRRAPASAAFTQKFPHGGRAPVEPTTVRVLYDDEAIWVGFACAQSVPIVRRLTRRDRAIESDWVSVALGTRRDGVSAFEFRVSAAGVLLDTLRFNDTDEAPEWDENWQAHAAPTDGGWSAELRIPLRILRFDRLREQPWGFQARRYVSARQETDEWAFIPRDAAGEVSRYGRLTALRDLRSGAPVELRPFAASWVRRRDPVPEVLAGGFDYGGTAGLDAKWHVTQNLTLDATLNPDFAQVEADQVVLNLTTFEVFLPEKRPFFLEGIDAFATPLPLLYTRRIGLAPAPPEVEEGERLDDLPGPSTIYGAAKLIGTTGRLTVGALSALTARNEVRVRAGPYSEPRLAEPLTLWDALRLRLAVGENAHLGLLATAVNRFDPSRHDAYAVAADFRFRAGDWAGSGQAVVTALHGGPPRALSDGTVLSSGDAGAGGVVAVRKEGGRFLLDLQVTTLGEKLDWNDLGYLRRGNFLGFDAVLGYRTVTPFWRVLETRTRLEFFDRENLRGQTLGRLYQLNTNWKFAGFWQLFTELHYRAPRLDDREVGDGTALERAGLFGLEVELSSDPRRVVSCEVFSQWQRLSNGWALDVEGAITLRALPRLDVELLPQITFTTGEPRFVGAEAGRSVFGRLTATAAGATLRATWTFTPRLTLQVYAQLFLAAKRYREFLAAPANTREVLLSELRAAPPPSVNPDLQEGVLNLNVVLRWEYLPGSTLFLVYTRAQIPALGGGHGALDLGAVGRAPASDVLLLKATYFWG